jgi:hypothetical protein
MSPIELITLSLVLTLQSCLAQYKRELAQSSVYMKKTNRQQTKGTKKRDRREFSGNDLGLVYKS